MAEDFLYYPEYEDDSFYDDIYRKKEFNRSKVDPTEFHNNTMENLCGNEEKILQPHQEFVRNYLSDETPYKGLLLFHGVGTGKCLHPDSQVFVNGTTVRIADLWKLYHTEAIRDPTDGVGTWSIPSRTLTVNCFDQMRCQMIERQVSRLYRQFVSEQLVILTLESGQIIKLTQAHHLLTENGWSNNFVNNQYVSVPKVVRYSKPHRQYAPIVMYRLGFNFRNSAHHQIPNNLHRGGQAGARAFLNGYLGLESPHTVRTYDEYRSLIKRASCTSPNNWSKLSYLLAITDSAPMDYEHYINIVTTNPNMIEWYRNEEVELVKIKSVSYRTYLGYVYDLEVPVYHNYVADGVICHNTCVAISLAEALKPRLLDMGKKVYIIAPDATQRNFENEIYDFQMEKKEQEDKVEPGSYQCTGQTYYIPFKKEASRTGEGANKDSKNEAERRKRQIQRNALGKKSVYHSFFGHGPSFPQYIENEIPKKLNRNPAEIFSDSLIIVDEAHNLIRENDVESRENKKGKPAVATVGTKREVRYIPVKNTIETLNDLLSGYHRFKEDYRQANKATLKHLDDRQIEVVATTAWQSLPAEERRRKWLKYGAQNVKILLMTATPIENDPTELVQLLNILRMNDHKPLIDPARMFPKPKGARPPTELSVINPADGVDVQYLCAMSKGYISYVRGQNPISFPGVFDPPDRLLYNPAYVTEEDNVPVPFYKIDEDTPVTGTKIPLRLVYSPFSLLQFEAHRAWIKGELVSKTHAKQAGEHAMGGVTQLGLYGRQIGAIVFPSTSTETVKYGNQGFEYVFERQVSDKAPLAKSVGGFEIRQPTSLKYRFSERYKTLGLDGLRAFIKRDQYDPNGADYGNLHKYSTKFAQILDNIGDTNSWGIDFVYSEFKEAGAVALGVVAELNGFVRFSHESSFRLAPINAKTAESLGFKYYDRENPPMIYENNDPLINVRDSIYPALGHKPLHRCYKCGQLLNHPYHNTLVKTSANTLNHRFVQGTFILFIGEGSENRRSLENDIVKQRANSDGSIIKLVMGSKKSGEGVNFMNVRQVHILEPWHHYPRLYQAIGRAMRHCSHINLPLEKRNVTIFKYCSAPPEILGADQKYIAVDAMMANDVGVDALVDPTSSDKIIKTVTYRDLLTETTDEMVYLRVIRKDIFNKYVERLLKQCAVDCALFKAMNVFPNSKYPAERDGSRLCDYMECNYQCIWDCGPPIKYWDGKADVKLNEDTYNLFFSKVQIDRIVRYIQKIFLENWALTLNGIVKEVHRRDSKISVEYIYEAVDRMLRDATDRPVILDRYKREGYLVFRGDYYVVQPFVIGETDVPISYRIAPNKVQSKQFNISKPLERIIKATPVVQTVDTTGQLNALITRLTPERIQLETILDRVSRKDLQYIYEKIYLEQRGSPLQQAVTKYLRDRQMILDLADKPELGHHIFETPRVYKADGKKFVDEISIEADEYLKFTVLKDEQRTVLFDPDKDLYHPPVEDRGISIITYRFYGYFDETDNEFKVVDLSTEATKKTKEDVISRKTYNTGKRCETFLKPSLVYIANSLARNPLLKPDESAELQRGLTKDDLCVKIERALRLLNQRDRVNRWLLYPGEAKCIEYDAQGRHILRRNLDKPRSCDKTADKTTNKGLKRRAK